jgi:hypothetical protein
MGNQYLRPGMAFDDTPRGDGNCTRQVAYYFEADPNLIPFSHIYNENNGAPYINFCAKLSLYTEAGELVTWTDVSIGTEHEDTPETHF